jgi:hypothetical protein
MLHTLTPFVMFYIYSIYLLNINRRTSTEKVPALGNHLEWDFNKSCAITYQISVMFIIFHLQLMLLNSFTHLMLNSNTHV